MRPFPPVAPSSGTDRLFSFSDFKCIHSIGKTKK